MLPDEPKTWTVKSLPGNSVSRICCTLFTKRSRTSTCAWFGCIRPYSSRMSPLSLSSSWGSNVFLGSSFAGSSMSDEWYGTRRRPRLPTLVSYWHLSGRPSLRVGIAPFASEDTERGEWLPRPSLGDGERECDSYLRADCIGVEGTEFECCETMEGRWARRGGAASSRLVAMVFGMPFGVMVDVLGGTLRGVLCFPSVVACCAGPGFAEAFVETGCAESRDGGGLSEWGDTMTAGTGVCEAAGCSSSMRARCRNGCSSVCGGAAAGECTCSWGEHGGDQRAADAPSNQGTRCAVWRWSEWMVVG